MVNCIRRSSVLLVVLAVVSFAVAGTSAKATELHFLSWFSPEMQPKYLDFANVYMAEHFPGVTVTGASTDGTGQNYNSKVMVSIAAGAGPDLYLFNIANFEPAWVDKYNLMLPLDGRLDTDRRYKADLPPALLHAWSYNGKLYGLPTTIGQYAIYYNRDHYAQRGLTNPADDWTIAGDFAGNIRKLALYKSDGTLQRYGLHLQTALKGRFMNYVMSNGGHVVDEDVTQARIGEPEFLEIVELFQELLSANLIMRGGTGQAYDRFVAGNASMLMSGIFYQSRVEQNAGFDWGVARLPAGKAGRQTVANTNGWVVNPQGANIEMAWELAKAFSGAEFTELALKEGLEFPVALSALRRHFFATLPPNLSRSEGEIWLEAMDYIRPFPKHPLMEDIWTVAQAQVNLVWNGKQSPFNALRVATEQINGIIRQGVAQ